MKNNSAVLLICFIKIKTTVSPLKMLSYCILTSYLVLLVHSFEDDSPVVQTSLGTISGHYKTSHDGRTFSAYEGIPYAKPPIGDLRFQAPQQLEPWIGTWNAIVVQTCVQPNQKGEMMGNEDCLYLNVYVPKEKINENLDVVVHIHGGAFMMGTPEFGGPELLMDRDIVYVSIDYRLGIFGFLYTEDDSVSGNNGLKDQILALKWIQTHIKDFGGNPNSVTIIGLSAGAASVHLHYFSPLANGLFHRGISQSGTALAPWAIQKDPLLMAEKVAKLVGCPITSTKELVKCLKQRPAQDIVKYSYSASSFNKIPSTPFAPVVEKEKGENAYLTDYPYNLLVKGEMHDIPWMCSATSGEGVVALIIIEFQVTVLANQWNSVIPLLLEYDRTVETQYQDEVSEKIKQFYYGEEIVSNENIQTFIKLYGDRMFYLDMEQATRMQAKVAASPVYSSLFGYIGEYKGEEPFDGIKDSYGVGHGFDGQYCYNITSLDFKPRTEKFTGNDELIKNMMLDIITSFARSGKPIVKNVTWEPINSNSEDYQYLSINNDDIKIVATKELAPIKFWHSLPIRENENLDRSTNGSQWT